MKVLIIDGSPREKGNTGIGINEMVKAFGEEGIETETVKVGNKNIRGCMACNYCASHEGCVFNDVVNELAAKLEEADGLVIASPVYFASAAGTLVSCLDRLFYSMKCDTRMKVGASVCVARRGGLSATFDELNKYFTISGMPVASSRYWNSIHGAKPGEAAEDLEGLDTMRTLAKNMSFLIKSIALGKAEYGLPAPEQKVYTNFVR